MPGRRLHRAWPRPADAEPRLQQRPRPDVDEICQEPGHRPWPEGLQGPEGVLARADEALDHGHRAARSAQGAILRVARSQVVDGPERLRSGWRHGRRVGVSRSLPASRRGRTGPDALGARRRHQPGRHRAAAPPGSTSSARSTAAGSSPTIRPIRRDGPTTARTSTPRSRSRTCRPATDAVSGWRGPATGSTPTSSRR